jgi:hypothetical protein
MSYQERDNRFIVVPYASIHTDELYMYGKKEWITEPDYSNKNSLNNLLSNHHHNKLSEKSKTKVKRAIKYLVYQSTTKTAYNYKTNSRFKFKLTFITLTLSSVQIHTDNVIKKTLLNQFLIEAKKHWQVENYVWKMEHQLNGNVHFHVLTDKFIPWIELRNTWNRIQNKLGYIDRYTEKTHKKNPNSTDIHSLKDITNIANYMIKYMTKSQGNVECGGRIWTCCKVLSNIKGVQETLSNELMKEIELLQKEKDSRRLDKEHFTGIFYQSHIITKKKYPLIYSLFTDYINNLFPKQQKEIWNDEPG